MSFHLFEVIMFRFLLLLPMLGTCSAFCASASPLKSLYLQLQQQKQQVRQLLLNNAAQYDWPSSELMVDYIRGQGVQFRILPASPASDSHVEQTKMVTAPAKVNQHQAEQQTMEFNQVKQSAKQLSHQSYNLERQISSMERALDDQPQAERQALLARIAQDKQQLLQLQQQKNALKPKYQQLQTLLTQDNLTQGDRPSPSNSYASELSTHLCHAIELLELLPTTESIAFIFYSAAQQEIAGQSKIYNFPNQAIKDCQNQKIAITQLTDHAIIHDF
jgi:DNA repair exonuclease SbcCD ATPase subunit